MAGPKSKAGTDLFSIQFEVTEKLLEAEEKKLRVLKTEVEASKHSDAGDDSKRARELEMQENSYLRIKMQHQRLAQEMQDIAEARMVQRQPKMKVSRSLPAIVMKPAHKPRPSVFDHLVPKTAADVQANGGGLSPGFFQGSMVAAPGQNTDELQYKDGVLVAGSLNELVTLLVPTETHYPERTYMFAFLLCSRLFIKPYELLSRVTRMFHIRLKQFNTSGKPSDEGPGHNMVQCLSEWTEMYPYDFRDERMMRSLKELTQTCAAISTDLRRSVGQLQSALVQKLSVLDKYEHVLSQVNAVAMDRLIDPTTQVNLLSVCEDPTILAQQLTHIEMERLNNIGPEEFIQAFEKTEAEPLYRDLKKTSNLEAYVEWFNRLSYLVATEICVAEKKKSRGKLIEFFADTALECRRLHNYNSYMAICAGLFMSSVTRLKKTRSRVTSGKLQSIEDFMDPMGNFSIYRHHLEKAVSEANQGKSGQRWVVPFFSLIVKDIYFMQQSSGKTPSGLIRFDKCIAQARLVSQILCYKDIVLPFPRVRAALNYLMTIPVHTDDELQLASFEIEPPDNSGERKRYQDLKMILGSFGGRIKRTNSTGSTTSTGSSPPPTFPTIREEA
ncbi:ras-GEF domain-containing family member 1B-like [Halichondria panicea]|uniref:ras-GEF domain-containing family member 1B-like n=1 Tax=Halichondria panicea TaxID=6063 RepID=UPI00312B5D83